MAELDQSLDLDLRIQKKPGYDDYEVSMYSVDLGDSLRGLAQAIADIGAKTGLGTQKVMAMLAVILFKK